MVYRRGRLKAAHQGYRYQDIATAYVLTQSLVHRYDRVIVDRKEVPDDRLDDLAIWIGQRRARLQIKHSHNTARTLDAGDFADEGSSLRFDRLVRTYVSAGSEAAEEYRLCATWRVPDDTEFLSLLEPADVPGLVDGWPSRRYRFRGDRVWPAGGGPIWRDRMDGLSREQVLSFCTRFIIELELPAASESLMDPGPFERAILALLRERVGIGRYPNHHRSPDDVAALAIDLASRARAHEAELTPEDVEAQLGIRTDYGRVPQAFPLNPAVFQERPAFRRSLFEAAQRGEHQLVVGPPGAGKSWELTQLAEDLRQDGVLVARHYCYLEPGDELVERRITVDALFGNLLAELSDAAPELRNTVDQRYTASLRSVEEFLEKAVGAGRAVVLIIDGLDHIARVRASSRGVSDEDTDIVDQLATLVVPSGAALIVGSQPGAHLDPLREPEGVQLIERRVPPWSCDEIGALARDLGVEEVLAACGERDIESVLNLLSERAEGNPLYATMLSRGLLGRLATGEVPDAREWLEEAPAIDGNVAVYYSYLYAHAGQAAQQVADILGVIDFAVTETDLTRILPPFLRPWIGEGLRELRPVLDITSSQGGIRVFHESFRRFVTEELARRGRSLAGPLELVIAWLMSCGFIQDAKAYRFLLPALRRADRGDEAVAMVGVTFVSDSVANGHPLDAVQRNLSLVMDIAARHLLWSDLTRFVELHRALYTCYEDKLHDPIQYWETYLDLFGPEAVAERLLFDGKPTQSRDLGLLLCSLVDDAGATSPWREYLNISEELEDDDDLPPGLQEVERLREERVALAELHGLIRLEGVGARAGEVLRFLVRHGPRASRPHVRGLANRLIQASSPGLVERMLSRGTEPHRKHRLHPRVVADLKYVLAREHAKRGRAARAAELATELLHASKHMEEAVECIRLGADPAAAVTLAIDPSTVVLDEYFPHSKNLRPWVAAVRLWAWIDDAVLEREAQRVAREGWYWCWLRFVIALARAEASEREGSATSVVLDAFSELVRDVRPFAGEPKPSDLFQIRALITQTIGWGLSLLRSADDWEAVLQVLETVLEGTGTTLGRDISGPLHPEDLVELLLPYAHRPEISDHLQNFVEGQVSAVEGMGTYFEAHSRISMLMVRILCASGKRDPALALWNRIGVFLGGYGFRKDVTIYELISSAPALVAAGDGAALAALAAAQPLADAMLRHTDGRSTNRAPNAWLRSLLRADPAAGLTILAGALNMRDSAEGWVADTALEDALESVGLSGDPQLLADLYAALPFIPDHENEGRDRADAQLKVIDRLLEQDGRAGEAAFRQLAAQVTGDGHGHEAGALSMLLAYAADRKLSIPSGVEEHIAKPSSDANQYRTMVRWAGIAEGMLRDVSAPSFPPEARDVDLVAAIRRTEDPCGPLGKPSTASFVTALGYRLVCLVHSGEEERATRLLRFFAREAYVYESGTHPLADLAEGLDRYGCSRLAALAYAYAYVRSRGGGGYSSIGDVKQERLLLRAFELGGDEARRAFALEIAYGLRGEFGNQGITQSLVQRAAAWGDPEVARDCWWAAYGVIAHRIPMTAERPGPFPRLEIDKPLPWSVDEGLAAVLLARINHPVLTRKVPAAGGVARAIRLRTDVVVEPLRWFFCQDTPITSVILVMQLLLECEQESHPLTRGISEILAAYAGCGLWALRLLSAGLLDRAGLDIPAGRRPSAPVMDSGDPVHNIEALLSADEGDRVGRIAELWPEFPALVSRRMDALFHNTEVHQDECRERLILALGSELKERPSTPVLRWETEIFEIAFNEVLNGLDEHLWAAGLWSPDLGIEALHVVLPSATAHIGMQWSRAPRPTYPVPAALKTGVEELRVLSDDSQYRDWIRLAYVEEQWLRESGPTHAPKERVWVVAGAVVLPVDGAVAAESIPPVYKGDFSAWWLSELPPPGKLLPQIPVGPLVALAHAEDWLGDRRVPIPPANLRRYLPLNPAVPCGPLEWCDRDGFPAVVMRTWRVRDARVYRPEPAEYEGADLLVRPDVFARVASWAYGPVRESRFVARQRVRE